MPVPKQTDPLLTFLRDPRSYGLTGETVTHIETHASHLFLINGSAYKLKKALHLDFIDSRDRLTRRQFCFDEVRLNRRFAPMIYKGVVGIGQTGDGSFVFTSPDDTCVDFLVKMRRFSDDALLESKLKTIPPDDQLLVQFATSLAAVHLSEPACPEHPAHRVLEQYLTSNGAALRGGANAERVDRLLAFQLAQFARYEALMAQRGNTHVKQLHGDLHSRNICEIDNHLVAFDGIEFNADLNTIDTIADLAFLVMDLLRLSALRPLSIILSTYLRLTGDYQGLSLLPLFVSYRAAVRAKVSLLAATRWNDEAEQLMALAERAITYRQPILYAIGGLSGTGKSTVAQLIAHDVGGIVLRSDFLRKELFGVSELEPAPSHAYTEAASHDVYRALVTRAAAALASGLPVIVDATFLQSSHQRLITALGATLGARCIPIWCQCALSTAIGRIASRTGDPSDATGAIRAAQEERASPPLSDWISLSTEGSLEEVSLRIVSLGISSKLQSAALPAQ